MLLLHVLLSSFSSLLVRSVIVPLLLFPALSLLFRGSEENVKNDRGAQEEGKKCEARGSFDGDRYIVQS
jgi:hypothetical protein